MKWLRKGEIFDVMLQCEPGLGAAVMYDLLYNDPTKLMLLAGCSTVCTTVSEAAKKWNLVVVSEENLKFKIIPRSCIIHPCSCKKDRCKAFNLRRLSCLRKS